MSREAEHRALRGKTNGAPLAGAWGGVGHEPGKEGGAKQWMTLNIPVWASFSRQWYCSKNRNETFLK